MTDFDVHCRVESLARKLKTLGIDFSYLPSGGPGRTIEVFSSSEGSLRRKFTDVAAAEEWVDGYEYGLRNGPPAGGGETWVKVSEMRYLLKYAKVDPSVQYIYDRVMGR